VVPAPAPGPAAPNNCVLCVLEPSDQDAMLLSPTDTGGIHVEDGGIVVNSMSSSALHLLGSGDVTADQIRVLGNVLIPSPGLGQLLPPAELGGPPAVDPLGDLRTPDRVDPSLTVVDTAEVITGNTTLQPGVYRSIDVRSGGVLTLEEGVYVVTNFTGFTVRTGGRVEGTGATIFLACGGYPTPCGGGGARFRLENNGEFVVSPPTTGEYAGLSIFADKGNTRTMRLLGKVTLRGAVYAASGRLIVNSPDPGQPVQINALVAVDRLLKDGAGQLVVDYDPGSPLIGIGRPVLVR
jgi:hypothetical protein